MSYPEFGVESDSIGADELTLDGAKEVAVDMLLSAATDSERASDRMLDLIHSVHDTDSATLVGAGEIAFSTPSRTVKLVHVGA